MSFVKKALHSDSLCPVEMLSIPQGREWDVLNDGMRKVASIDKMSPVDLYGFDLQAAVKQNPDHLFVKVFAIKKDEVNDNGDAFSEAELKKAAHTFVGVPVFVNHQNDDVEKARGKVVHAWYDDAAGGIYIISMVDRTAYPKLARGIEERYIEGTSMGAQVGYSLCSVCHNRASTQDEFCSHVKERKNKKFSGKMKCRYHESDCKPSEDCPVCASKKGEAKELLHKDAKIYEHNFDIKFIEDSFVVNPACHDCLVCDILNTDAFSKKVASMMHVLKTAAASMESKTGSLAKTAGQKEIIDLNDAMNKLERVARSMMAQKQKIQLEYVSDIVESLSDIQTITDELIEMGYAQLPSPTEQEIAFGSTTPASPLGEQAQQMQPQQISQMGGMGGSMPQSQPQPSGSPQTGNLGNQVGTITKPSFSGASADFEKDFLKTSSNNDDSVKTHELYVDLFNSLDGGENVTGMNILSSKSNNDYKVVVSKDDSGNFKVAEYKNNSLLRMSRADVFDTDTQQLFRDNPDKVAESILQKLTKESVSNMAAQPKTAAGVDKGQIEQTTEAQLDQNRTLLGGRQDSPPEGITESKEQLGGSEKSNDTTSDSPQVRRGTYDTITEDQLASITSGYMVRWSDYPEVITEAQWDETSRAVRAELPDDWTESVTQQQLISLRDHHSWVDPNYITESQLADQKSVLPNDKTSRFAKAAPADLLKAAMNSVADAIAQYSLSPQQIGQAVARMTSNPKAQIKAARLALLNSLPRMIEARVAECKRRNYFGKIASDNVSAFKPIDALLASMGDNLGYLKADDLVDAVRFVAADSKIMKRAEQNALAKIASRNDETEVVVDRSAALRQAFAELDRSPDGIYQVRGSIKDDLRVDLSDRNRFLTAVDKFARSQVTAETMLTDVDVDTEAGTFSAIVKEASALSEAEKNATTKLAGCPPWLKDRNGCEEDEEEKKEASSETLLPKSARTAARQEMLKQAQMMGGQMGGGMGGDPSGMGGGGQGATMPAPPPGGEQPPVESFGEDPMADPMADEGAGEVKPPGSTCPACGKDDVDAAAGKSHCNNCGLDFSIKIIMETLNWPGVLDDGEGTEEEGDPLDAEKGLEEGAGEGFPMPTDQEPASLPVAAMTRLNPKAMQKLASMNLKIGDISPLTGSNNTMRLAGNDFLCLDTGNKYSIAIRGGKGKDENVYAEWRWIDRRASRECTSCHMQKKAFVNSLKSIGLTEAQFDSAKAMDKAKIILAMQDKGLLKRIKTAGSASSVLGHFKQAFGITAEKFPIESCREKLARRFGENAVAISGSCEGQNLADCVCNKLKTAGFYSDNIAIKLASIWSDEDGSVECWEDYIRSGLNAKQAATVCEQIRRKYSLAEHFMADAIDSDPSMGSEDPVGDADMNGDTGMEPAGDDLTDPNVDPFASDPATDVGGDPAGADPMNGSDPAVGADPVGGSDPLGSPSPAAGPTDLPIEILDALKHLNQQVIQMIDGQGGMPGGDPMGGGMPGGAPGSDPMEVSIDPMVGGPAAGVEVEMRTDDPSQIPNMAGEAVETAVDAVENAANESPVGPEIGEEPVSEESPFDGESSEEAPEGGESEGGEPEGFPGEESGESSDEEGDSEEPSDENGEEVLEKEGNDYPVMAKSNKFTKEAESLRKGRIVGNHKVNLDVSSILKVLNKKADQSGLVHKNVQDDPDIGTISNGGTIGKEDKFKAENPDVPSKGSGATMGHEAKDLHPGKSKPTVFTGPAQMGHESEQGYDSEKTNQHTGGEEGSGSSKSAKSTRNSINGLADRIIAARQKIAGEKKVEDAKPVSEDKDIGPFSNNKDLSTTNEGDKIQPFAEGDSKEINNVPERGEGSFMGHEKDSVKIVPKPENSAPQIPAGGGKNPKYDTKWDAEKQTSQKGTVIAQSDEKSKAKKEAATKLAGQMIERGIIKADQLATKIAELERYEIPQINDLEKAMFTTKVAAKAKKGLNTVQDGSEKAPVIADTSKFRNGTDELQTKLQSMFRLDMQNKAADSDPDSQLNRIAR